MARCNWMAVRAYAPCVVSLLFTAALMFMLLGLPDSPLLAQGLIQSFRWVPLLGLVTATGLFVAPTYRLVQWHRGVGASCPACGGPLGHERAGYASRGGAYRRCYACGNNVNHHHYE
ncbi:conserved hypothetical protein [Xanthomonas citri pv. citri]|nr:conserved hypothetical protein [Xanthomonas citri pv. citri]